MKFDFGIAAIESPFSFITIRKIELLANINEHVYVQIWGILDQKDALETIMLNHRNATIKITLSDRSIYFIGLPLEVEIKEQSGLFQIRMTCISTSYLLDIYPHQRSYQDVNMKFADVIKTAYSQEKDSLFMAGDEGNVTIGSPIFQYNETEWEFTLRMANKLMTCVITDYRAGRPNSTLGLIEAQTISLDKIPFGTGYTQEKGYFYSCKLSQQLKLGDVIVLHGRSLFVVKVHSIFLNGEFINTYILGTKEGYYVKKNNLTLSGCRLFGSVLDTNGEKIKIHLDIDKEQNVDKAYWFDFVPQSGNVMYCMPQIGTKVILRFCSNQENSAIIEECWRENGLTCLDMNDYKNRYFTSEFGKRMAMLQKTFFLKGDENQAELSDSSGISFQSSNFTRIIGEEDISIVAGKKCHISVPRHIYLTKINTKSVVDFAGNEINIESENTNITTMFEMTPDSPYSTDLTPAVTIKRHLAEKVLAYVPKKSG